MYLGSGIFEPIQNYNFIQENEKEWNIIFYNDDWPRLIIIAVYCIGTTLTINFVGTYTLITIFDCDFVNIGRQIVKQYSPYCNV